MIEVISYYCLIGLFFALGLNLIRIVLGPSQADRAVAADAIFLNLIGLTSVYSIYINSNTYFDLILVFSLLGFVGTVCFSKFLARGKIIE